MTKPPEPAAEPGSPTHPLPPPDPSHYRPPIDPADTPGMYDPVTLPPAYPQPSPPPPGRDSTGLLIAVAVGGLCLLAVIGLVVYLVARPGDGTGGAVSIPDTGASDSETAAGGGTAPPVDPRADIGGDGTFVLGEDIEAGQYRTTVPQGSALCYWERLRGLSGDFDDIIANGVADPGDKLTVTLAADDRAFKTQGCGAWNAA